MLGVQTVDDVADADQLRAREACHQVDDAEVREGVAGRRHDGWLEAGVG